MLGHVTLAAERATRTGRARTRNRTRPDTPVLVRHVRNGIEESLHRGDIVEADATGRLIRSVGDPDRVVTLRSTVKAFGVVALIEAGGIEVFDLEPLKTPIPESLWHLVPAQLLQQVVVVPHERVVPYVDGQQLEILGPGR